MIRYKLEFAKHERKLVADDADNLLVFSLKFDSNKITNKIVWDDLMTLSISTFTLGWLHVLILY